MDTRVFRTLALVALHVVLPAGILETYLRVVHYYPTYKSNLMNVVLDETLLYRIKPDSNNQINELGFRDYEFQTTKTRKKRVLVLGDSFVMGLNVKLSETVPKRLEKMLGDGFEVYNMGIWGDGPDQSYLRFTRSGSNFSPDLVILSLFPANDYNDLYKNRLFLPQDGGFVFNKSNPVASSLRGLRLVPLARRFVTGKYFAGDGDLNLLALLFDDTPDSLSTGAVAAAELKKALMKFVLLEFKKEMSRRGVPFFVYILPSYEGIYAPKILDERGISPQNYYVNEEVTDALCRETGIACLSFLAPFLEASKKVALYDLKDRHLSAEGNAFVARVVCSYVRDRLSQE